MQGSVEKARGCAGGPCSSGRNDPPLSPAPYLSAASPSGVLALQVNDAWRGRGAGAERWPGCAHALKRNTENQEKKPGKSRAWLFELFI